MRLSPPSNERRPQGSVTDLRLTTTDPVGSPPPKFEATAVDVQIASFRPVIATRAPSAWNALAAARPMPLLPPSTTTLLPAKRMGSEHSVGIGRSEEHTSELQSLTNLVCRLLLEKKKNSTQLIHE